jgi:hypothetical protein
MLEPHPHPKVAYTAGFLLVIALVATAYFLGKAQLVSAPTATATPPSPTFAVTLSSPSPSNSAPIDSTANCDHLSATLSNGEGTAGTYYYRLALTNKSTSACNFNDTVAPTLVPLDTNGAELGTVQNGPASHLVQLFPAGTTLYAAIGFPNADNFDKAADCKAMKSLRLDMVMNSQDVHVTLNNIDSLQPGYTDYFCKNTLTITHFSSTPQ